MVTGSSLLPEYSPFHSVHCTSKVQYTKEKSLQLDRRYKIFMTLSTFKEKHIPSQHFYHLVVSICLYMLAKRNKRKNYRWCEDRDVGAEGEFSSETVILHLGWA